MQGTGCLNVAINSINTSKKAGTKEAMRRLTGQQEIQTYSGRLIPWKREVGAVILLMLVRCIPFLHVCIAWDSTIPVFLTRVQ